MRIWFPEGVSHAGFGKTVSDVRYTWRSLCVYVPHWFSCCLGGWTSTTRAKVLQVHYMYWFRFGCKWLWQNITTRLTREQGGIVSMLELYLTSCFSDTCTWPSFWTYLSLHTRQFILVVGLQPLHKSLRDEYSMFSTKILPLGDGIVLSWIDGQSIRLHTIDHQTNGGTPGGIVVLIHIHISFHTFHTPTHKPFTSRVLEERYCTCWRVWFSPGVVFFRVSWQV